MFIMSSVVWKQRDLVAVQLRAFEPQLPIATPDPKESKDPKDPGTLPRFWSANGENMDDLAHWEKPKGIDKIMGLVFYGRRQSVSILDCYLKVDVI
jgi:hypothetical protein